MDFPPRAVSVLSLIAIPSVVVFVLLRPSWIALVAVVNVVLITAALAIALSPHDHDAADGAGTK